MTGYELKLAWRNGVARPVQTVVALLVVALAVGLFVTISHLNDGLQRGIVRASDPFGVLVVGAKGSAQQLVLSTLLLQGVPVGNIDGHIVEELEDDPRAALVVPLAMGDNVGGARIIGTNEAFFDLRTDQAAEPAFRVAEGARFTGDFEAVLGSTAARGLGLQVGEQFVGSHGVEPGLEDDVHAEPYTVVGILASSNTPYDNAVLTTVRSVNLLHEHGDDEADDHGADEGAQTDSHESEGAAGGAGTEQTDGEEPHAEDAHGAEEAAHGDGDGEADTVTAVLVRPAGFIEANELWRDFYVGTEAQAAFPGAELGSLFDLLNQGQRLLQAVGVLAALMAAFTLFLAVYSAVGARERLLASLRALGANRGSVFRLVLFEALAIALVGGILGRLLGYGVAWLLAQRLATQSAIEVRIGYLPGLEPLLWLAPLLLGLAAGLLPAWQAYRANVVERLYPG